jgi:hypothetical protein
MDWLISLGLPYQAATIVFYLALLTILIVLGSLLALALCIFIPTISSHSDTQPPICRRLARTTNGLRRKATAVLNFHSSTVVPTYSEGVKMLRSVSRADFERVAEHIEELQFRLTRKFVDPLQQREEIAEGPNDDSQAIARQQSLTAIQEDLSSLSKLIDRHNDVEVPALQLNDQDHDRRRQGSTTLIIFAPLLIFVIILNTYLLSMFFRELLGVNDTSPLGFGVPIKLSHIISFMFTSIEVGIGIYFGTTEYNPPKSSSVTAVTKTFGWTILVMLALVEFTIYLMLSFGIGPAELGGILADYSGIDLMAEGWMALFGPVIVMALFIFGHQVCYAFLQVRHTDSLHRLQQNLDTTDDRLESIAKRVDSLAIRITELKEAELAELRFHNPSTEQLSEKELKALEERRDAEIKDIENALSDFVSSMREIAGEIPDKNDEVEHEKSLLPFREQASFFVTDVLIGLLSVASLVGFVMVGQSIWVTVGLPAKLASDSYIPVVISVCLGGTFLLVGHFIFQSLNLTVDQGRLLVRSSPSQIILKAASATFFIASLIATAWAFKQSQGNWILLGIFLVLSVVLVLLGNRLVISIFALRSSVQLILLYFGRYLALLLFIFILGLVELRNVLSKLLHGLADPWFKLFPMLAR